MRFALFTAVIFIAIQILQGFLFVGLELASTDSELIRNSPSIMIVLSILPIILLGVLYAIFAKRRLNDLNQAGWFCLLLLVPILNIVFVIYLLAKQGFEEANDFGPPLEEDHVSVKILGILSLVVFYPALFLALAQTLYGLFLLIGFSVLF